MTIRCKHIEAIKRDLREAGASDIAVVLHEGRQLRVSWTLRGRPCLVMLAAHPRDAVVARNTSRQAVKRACREARV